MFIPALLYNSYDGKKREKVMAKKDVKPTSYCSRDIYNNKLVKTYPPIPSRDLAKRLADHHKRYLNWSQLSLGQRSTYLMKIAALLRQNQEKLALTITEEVGKLLIEARGEVEKCAWCLEHFAEQGPHYLQSLTLPGDGNLHRVDYLPLGPVLAVMPWNFPLWQIIRVAAPTLMLGNTVILKPAPEVPRVSLALELLFKQAAKELNIVSPFDCFLLTHKQVPLVMAWKPLSGVSFTGSTATGKIIAALAGAHLKKVVLELGGSDPFLILPSLKANHLAEVVKVAIRARMINMGQSCIAAKRIFVPEALWTDFLKMAQSHLSKFSPGDPRLAETTLAPLFSPRALPALTQFLKLAEKSGGKIICGGKVIKHKAPFFSPTILALTHPVSSLDCRETFGPILVAQRYKKLESALEQINASPYGLGASVWGAEAEAEQASRQIACGSIFINGMVKSDPRIPFGGVKESGLGRELGPLGITEFANAKSVSYYGSL